MTINNRWVHLIQWFAVISMTADHAARYLVPDSTEYTWLAASLGRLAFPFFSALVAWHALFNSSSLSRYSLRILVIGLLAQPGYAWMLQEPLQTATLNVCFTLAAGLILTGLLKAALKRQQEDSQFFYSFTFFFAVVLALLSAWLVSPWVDYGMTGLLLTPGFALSFYYFQQQQAGLKTSTQGWAAWLLPIFLIWGLNPAGLPTYSSFFALFLLVALLQISQAYPLWQPSFPRRLWLSWYPLHLLVIAGAARWLA